MDVAHNESAEKMDSLFHRSASFAIYAIIASFVLQFIYAQIWLGRQNGSGFKYFN